MSKSDWLENELLEHIFLNANLPQIGDPTGLRSSTTQGSFYVSLHTADPGEAGNQSSNEAAYTSYARMGLARAGGYFAVTANVVTFQSDVSFPKGTGGGETVTHFGIGTDSSGAGYLLYSGPIDPDIITGDGITPILLDTTTITED